MVAPIANHIVKMTDAAIQLLGFSSLEAAAIRNSCINGAEINRTASIIPSGSKMTSSKYPITGIKSGIRSIGETA